MSENLEINHIVPVTNNIQVNQNHNLQNVNQSVDDSSVINDVALSNVEEINRNLPIIENTNIQNAKLDTSNSGLIKELDSQNLNKVVEALDEQLNKKESEEIKSSKSLKLSVNKDVDISPETIRELANNLQLEEVATSPSIIKITNIQNDELSTSNDGLIKELDSQNVNKVVEALDEQFNKKKSKEIVSDKRLELPTNQNTDVNPKTIKKLYNSPDLENTI
jgi:hypothetical protein